MNIFEGLEDKVKVFIDAAGQYYLGLVRRSAGDSHLPSPAPALVEMLRGAATLQVNEVGVQVAQDVVLTHAMSGALPSEPNTTQEPNTTTAEVNVSEQEPIPTEPAKPAEVSSPQEVTSQSPVPEPTSNANSTTPDLNP